MTTTTIDRTKARGIPFRDELVPWIMRDIKTQTRRLLNPQPVRGPVVNPGFDEQGRVTFSEGWHWDHSPHSHNIWRQGEDLNGDGWAQSLRCMGPYGPPGSILYVKEAIAIRSDRWTYKADGADVFKTVIGFDDPELIRECQQWYDEWPFGKRTPYRSTRFMPKWAARTFLEITDVRVQQVRDITEADAIAEGMSPTTLRWWQGFERREDGSRAMVEGGSSPDGPPPDWMESPELQTYSTSAAEAFRTTWNRIHGADAWERNDWLWAYTFKRIA